MRFRAMKDAGWKDCPVIQVDWSEDKQREFIIKDNLSHGEWNWDDLGNNWDAEELKEWGMNVWQSEEASVEEESNNYEANSGTSLVIQFNSEEEAQRSHSLIAQALSGFGIMAACGAGELLAAQITGSESPSYAPAFNLNRYQDPEYQRLLEKWEVRGQL